MSRQRASAAPLVDHGPPAVTRGGPLLELTHVDIGYDRTPVLSDLTFAVRSGDFVGIVGPSGAGKTSLLRAVLGQTRKLGGDLVTHPRPGRSSLRIGYVPQVETVDWNFPITVEQVVLLGRWREMGWLPWGRSRDRQLAAQVLDRLGIGHLASRQIRALSGGQQQRVFLARALIGDPDLLLLDEPTSGVDIKTRHEVMHVLGELNRAGTTILLTTHELNAVATHLPRLLCVGHRRLVADGPPEHVLTTDVLRETYGADMVVIHNEGAIYVVEHAGGPGPLPGDLASMAPGEEREPA